MKKYLAFILMISIICMSFLLLNGCSREDINPNDIDYIEFREGSLKPSYSVDEKLDFSKIYIVIVLKENKGDIVEKVLPSMLEGFDTKTTTTSTETRAMRAKYMGFYTTYWNYIVTNPFDIKTNARLNLGSMEKNDELEVTVSLDIKDLSNIQGMMMDISFDTTKIIRKGEIESILPNWEVSVRAIREGTFSVLFYRGISSSSINEDSDLFIMRFNILGSENANIELKNIILSDGEEDIHLPNSKLR